MLGLPLHRSDPYSIGGPVRAFFESQSADMHALEADINMLNVMRAQAVSVAGEPVDSTALLRYNYHLSSLAPRFASYDNELKFQFNYTDPFRPQQRVVCSSIYFEWGCVLWNLAALESLRGTRADRSTDEGIRSACKFFQQACGILDLIKEKILPMLKGVKATVALSEDGVMMARHLMFGQAQSCFYEKSVLDKKTGTMKAAIVGKLAQQASVYFNQAYGYSKTTQMAALLDSSWGAYAHFQTQAFAGASEFWTAMGAKENALQKGTGFGEEIVRLTRAEAYYSQAVSSAKMTNTSAAVYGPIESILRTTIKSKAAAVKDNANVYMEPLPPENQVLQVAPISMVRPSAVLDYAGDNQLFPHFMPRQVLALAGAYRSKINELLRGQRDRVTENSNAARSLLSSVGLPGSLEAYRCGGTFPENLYAKLERVRASGGMSELRRKLRNVSEAAERCRGALNSVEARLSGEEEEDAQFRVRCVDFSAVTSRQLSIDIRAHLQLLMEAYDSARASDGAMAADIDSASFAAEVDKMCLPKSQLLDMLPQVDLATAPVDTLDLERGLVEVAAVLDEREEFLRGLAVLAEESTVAGLQQQFLASVALGQSEAQILEAAMQPSQQFVQQIDGSMARQNTLIPELMRLNDVFTEARTQGEGSVARSRDRFITELEQAATQYFALNSQLGAGTGFYGNLEMQITTLLQSSNDMSVSQHNIRTAYEQREAREYERIQAEARDRKMAEEMEATFRREMEEQRRKEAEAAAATRAAFEAQHRAQLQQQPGYAPYGAPSNQNSNAPQGGRVPSWGGSGSIQYGAPPPTTGASALLASGYGAPQEGQQAPTGGYGGANGYPPGEPPPSAPMNRSPSDPYASSAGPRPTPSYAPQSGYGNPGYSGETSGPRYQQPPGAPPASNYPPPPMQQQQSAYPTLPPKPNSMGSQYSQQQSGYPPQQQSGYPPQQQSGYPPQLQQGQQQGESQYPSPYPQMPQNSGQNPAPSQQEPRMPRDDAKIARLVDMGFPHEAVVNALNSANQNEDTAISMLLSPSPAAQPAPAPAASGSGLFGKLWGKK